MEDWIKKWYNDQFSKIDLSPSSEVWENISVSMEEWPKHWYKSNTNGIKTEPRPSTWQALSSQLADINYPARKERPAYIMIATVIFVLSLVPSSLSDGYMYSSNTRDFVLSQNETGKFVEENVLGSNKLNTHSNKTLEKQETNTYLNAALKENYKFNTEVVNNSSPKELFSSLTVAELPIIKRELINEYVVDNSLIHENLDIVNLQPTVIGYPQLDLSDDLIYRTQDISDPNYSVGLHFVPQFSSLINPLRTKIRGDQDMEILNRISVGLDLSFEKHISPKNSLRVNVRVNNIKSLEFKQQDVLKEIKLNYASLDLVYNRNWSLGNTDKLILKTYIGVFAGFAVSKGVNYDGNRVDYIEDGLKNTDFGNSAGLILSGKLTDRIRLELGANSQFGAMNIFKGTAVLPSKYFRTSTLSYGLSVGLIKEF